MSDYPETISLEGEKLAYLVAHSALLANLYENQGNEGPLELSADLLFQGDQGRWKLFYDLIFPEEGVNRLFRSSGKNVYVNANRGGKEAVREMLDYLMVDSPATMMNFARAQARQALNRPSEVITTIPRAKGKANDSRVNLRNNYNNFGNNINYNNYNNNNNNDYNNTKIGYTEEEESYLGKLKGSTAQQYYRNQRRSRKTRRNLNTRRNRKSTRRTRK